MTLSNTETINWKLVSTSTQANIDPETFKRRMLLDQDPRWLMTFVVDDDKQLARFILEQSGMIIASATFFVHPSALRIAISDWTLFSMSVKRYTLFAEIWFDQTVDSDKSLYLLALFNQLRKELSINEVIFLQSVGSDSALSNMLARKSLLNTSYHILNYGEPYKHRYIDFNSDYNHYLSQLSSSTRSDLKRTQKRFVSAVNGQYKTICYQSPEEVGAFLDAAMTVSALTYQYQLLGAGLRDRNILENRFLTTAKLGWFHSYVLFVDQKPVAFQVGHLYQQCYYAQEIGYDPDWAKLQVGIFLHTEIISSLLATPDLVKRFDFGNDDNTHKQRLSNAEATERYIYLIPRHWRNDLFVATMKATNQLSTSIGRLLNKYGLRKRVRQLLWKLGVMK
ncbi:MAG: GNAT family N-acetyltransferase [Nitrosomonas sp.]|nr:GNAT family N-acetyltransferase [Nitrosomonas sp.]MBK7364378.1 GNAT family N-acetyltransferase [Nitrosomonas sp.]